jgi:hypothetical protein
MQIRRHLTYANVMATIAVFGVLAGGSAYAISKIDTSDIARRAVTAKKLDSKAVRTSKLGSNAVTGEKLADEAVEARNLGELAPVALAGVVAYNGTIFSWFNRINDHEPTLTRTEEGVYELQIPGIDGPSGFAYQEMLSSVNLVSDQPGEVTSRWVDCSGGGCLRPIVHTFDSGGDPADRSFVYLLYRADHVEQ